MPLLHSVTLLYNVCVRFEEVHQSPMTIDLVPPPPSALLLLLLLDQINVPRLLLFLLLVRDVTCP